MTNYKVRNEIKSTFYLCKDWILCVWKIKQELENSFHIMNTLKGLIKNKYLVISLNKYGYSLKMSKET